MVGEAAVDARRVVKRFGEIRAVDEVDLRVEVGEVRALLGPNGAGKTTLLRMLFGLSTPDSGTVSLLGRSWGEAGAGVLDGVAGFVDEPCFYPYLTARRNLELLAALDGYGARERVGEALEAAQLADSAGRRVGTYSRGMRQRLGVAAALLRAPRLLLLDEPTLGLDPASARELRDLVRRLPEAGVTVVLSSHDMAEAEGVCDSVTIMHSGRVVWDGTMERLRAEAPAPVRRLWTSDDPRALEIAQREPRLSARAERDEGLTLSAETEALDAYVLALGRAGVAVRRLELSLSPLESMFFELTEARNWDQARESRPSTGDLEGAT